MNDTTNKTEEPKGEQDSEKESEGQVKTEDLASTLEQEKERADRNLANWQRAQADLSNYKKRVAQEKQDLAKFANAALIGSMLNLVDDFQRARSTIPDSILGMTWIEGLFLIERKLVSTLEAAGLSEIKALGEDFDPNLHEAVMHGGGPEGKIIEEFQRGYKLHDRVIRPTMVKVGQGEAQEEAASGEGQQGPD